MKKKKATTEEKFRIKGQFKNKTSWGGEAKKGYIHYVTPDGEKISLKLGKD